MTRDADPERDPDRMCRRDWRPVEPPLRLREPPRDADLEPAVTPASTTATSRGAAVGDADADQAVTVSVGRAGEASASRTGRGEPDRATGRTPAELDREVKRDA